jgi:hypothetical protein
MAVEKEVRLAFLDAEAWNRHNIEGILAGMAPCASALNHMAS